MFSIIPSPNAVKLYMQQSRPFFQIGLCFILLGGVFSLSHRIFLLFSLTGNGLVSFELWRLFTNFVVEVNILAFIWSLWSLHQTASLIEPNWGLFETAKYLTVVQIGSSFIIAVFSLLIFIVAKDDSFFFGTRIYGSLAACSAVSVAVKQYLPDSIILTTPIGRLKNTHLPACIVFGSSVLIAFGLLRWVALLQILCGIQIGWIYLRFLQPHDDGEPKGDPSEHFAWTTLFPSRLQPIMKILSSAAYTCLIRTHLCKPLARHIDLTQLDSVNIILPGLQTKDTERRRQKALRDLTERLNRVQRVETGMWPEMEDVDEGTRVLDATAGVQQAETESRNTVSSLEKTNDEEQKGEITPI